MIDIGLNLTNGQFHDDQFDVLKRAHEAGVSACILTGTDVSNSQESLALCEEFKTKTALKLYGTAGVHPHSADDFDDQSIGKLQELLKHESVVAVGETGLDFNRNYSSKSNQIRAFQEQLSLAIETRKPLFLHERDAFKTQSAILSENLAHLPPVVIHCFTGTKQQLEAYLDMGFYIGITGWICDPKRGKELQKIVGMIPLNRLMIETDAPFLLPKNIEPKPNGRRNEPRYLYWVAKTISECTGVSIDEICSITAINARRFFLDTNACQTNN